MKGLLEIATLILLALLGLVWAWGIGRRREFIRQITGQLTLEERLLRDLAIRKAYRNRQKKG